MPSYALGCLIFFREIHRNECTRHALNDDASGPCDQAPCLCALEEAPNAITEMAVYYASLSQSGDVAAVRKSFFAFISDCL